MGNFLSTLGCLQGGLNKKRGRWESFTGIDKWGELINGGLINKNMHHFYTIDKKTVSSTVFSKSKHSN